MASCRCFSSMAIVFLATFSFSFSGCHADRALVDSICRQSHDYKFCYATLVNDKRAPAASSLDEYALLAISQTDIQIQDTLTLIPDVLRQSSDPLTHQRLGVCQNDYNAALGNFQSSFSTVSKHAYFDAINFVRDGTNQVIHCHNSFRMGGPIAKSPIDADDIKIFKLSEIILLIIQRLIYPQ